MPRRPAPSDRRESVGTHAGALPSSDLMHFHFRNKRLTAPVSEVDRQDRFRRGVHEGRPAV
jgi:hypothetical protein